MTTITWELQLYLENKLASYYKSSATLNDIDTSTETTVCPHHIYYSAVVQTAAVCPEL